MSTLPLILWRELLGGEPVYWWGATAIVIVTLFVSTMLFKSLKPIHGYLAILSLVFLLGFGGGWKMGLIPMIRGSQQWIELVENAPWDVSALSTHFLRLLVPLAILCYLLGRQRSFRDFFLIKGNIYAMADPSRASRTRGILKNG